MTSLTQKFAKQKLITPPVPYTTPTGEIKDNNDSFSNRNNFFIPCNLPLDFYR